MTACARAAEMDDPGPTHDSVGLAYAQLGRLDEAAAEFEAYLVWLSTQPGPLYLRNNGPLIEEWIGALERGENPINAEVLESLRG
ncbi:MAG: hypothetical protein HC802_07090 [Caldilineaceae bacterium]|nr:hypothetical protein [Caldilineaceae bacterium]